MSQSKPALPEPAEIAGRYSVVQKLGAGAFGTVFKAKDKILGRMVAIKTIRLEGLAAAGASLEELMERFKREAQVSAQLKHPNIVTIYDVGEADGLSYLAMEFIDGVGLERVIAGAGRLPLERAAAIAAQVADALDFAHKHGVVHRDIKPANIMIETGDRVKVTDFGIAKVTTSGEHLTMTGSLLGTPSYMSPEQARGGPIDGRSDLFSVGCILYEMLAGQKAFRGDSITALIFKIITEDPPPIEQLDAGIPATMVSVVRKALAKAADDRYQSGQQLAEALEPFTRAGSTPTIRQSETPTSRSSPAMVPPTLAGSALTASGAPPTQAAPKPSTPPPPPRAGAPRPAAPAPPAASATPAAASTRPAGQRKAGSGAGLLIGLGLVGIIGLGSVAAAGWYFLGRKRPPSPVPVSTTLVADNGASTPPVASPPAPPEVTAAPDTTPATQAARPEPAAPPVTQRPKPAPSAQVAAEPPPPAPTRPNAAPANPSFLDEEPPDQTSGAEAGQRLAQSYRSDQGRGSTSMGTTGRFRARERSPRNLAPAERPAVAAMRHVINAQLLFHKKTGRYGNYQELSKASVLFLDVPVQPREFVRSGYRFDLALEEDGFKVVASPMGAGPRPFIGDDSEFIREGVE